MKSKFLAFILLLTAGFSLSSCLNSDNDTNIEYTHDTAITAFSLGTLTRYYPGTSPSTGNDTTLSATVAGSAYKFYINQTTRQIYNADSLPVGTKTSAVLATITSKQSSPLLWVYKNQSNEDSLAYYSSSDSIDFSTPRTLRVYNNDFSAYVAYNIQVNVHQQDGEVFLWQHLAQNNAQLAALSNMKILSAGDHIYVFGVNAGNAKVFQTKNTDGTSWTEVQGMNVDLTEEACKGAIAKDGELYVLNNGVILKSSDAKSWEIVATDASLRQLIGASSRYLYAYSTTGISVSKDNGATWTAEGLDADASCLPANSLSMAIAPIRSTKDAETLLLVGNRAANYADSIATLWTRTVDYHANASAGKWNYVEYDAHQGGKLPYLSAIQVAANDSGYVALGAGVFKEGENLVNRCKWYKSNNGLTWSVDTTVVAPSGYAFGQPTALVRDNNNFYWVINNGNVWKGRYNRDGWKKD